MENLEKGTSSLKNTTDSIETLIRNKEEIAESIKSGKSSIVSLAEEVMKRIGES